MAIKKIIVRRESLNVIPQFEDILHPVLQRVYLHRGICSSVETEKNLTALIPYHQLLHADHAADYLVEALQQQQRIIIIGDFDADGATSTALGVSALRAFGAKNVDFLVPSRFTFGYGLTPEIVAVAAEHQPQLIITVDNGIANHAGVDAAKALGIRVIITDHHLPGEELPHADVIVNPNQPGDNFPSKCLAGVGVIFYVMLALRGKLRSDNWFAENNIPEPNMAQFLDLVALGTVADVVPLDRNNRILVHQGLKRIRAGQCRYGIQALLQISQRQLTHISASDLGFIVGPRLNAAGRLDDMSLGIECLLTERWESAQQIAQQLDKLNHERRHIQADMDVQAGYLLKKISLDNSAILPAALCLYEAEWHQGVIGILAGRIKDRYHRPTIVFAKTSNTELKGSARSIKALHMRDILALISTNHPDLICKFGGHAMAAGLTILEKDYARFCEIFVTAVTKQLSEDDLQDKMLSDGELFSHEFEISLAQLLRDAEPWGQGFSAPIFDGCFKVVQQRVIQDKHLKLLIQPKNSEIVLEAIAFNKALEINQILNQVQIAYRLDVNEYAGQKQLQLVIEHLESISD